MHGQQNIKICPFKVQKKRRNLVSVVSVNVSQHCTPLVMYLNGGKMYDKLITTDQTCTITDE